MTHRQRRIRATGALGIAEAIETSMMQTQIVTTPILDTRIAQLEVKLETRFAELSTRVERTEAEWSAGYF